MNFSSRLNAYRQAHQLTQAEMGAKLGVTDKYVGMLERGDKQVDEDSTIARLLALYESETPAKETKENRLREPMAEYKILQKPSSLSAAEILSQIRADLDSIESGSPAERRRKLLFLRDLHLPLLAQSFSIQI
jgi:transcriptional regulator with XRE-family HTH domain